MGVAPALLAVEGRIRVAALISAGVSLTSPHFHPMLDGINYLPRIRIPVLMLNGRYATILPYEQSQMRFFNLLGTPAKDKRLVLDDGAHLVEIGNQGKRKISDWFDRYLGPVDQRAAPPANTP